MKKKIISLSLVFMLLCTSFTVPATVNAKEDSLAPYRAVLEEMNAQLGTDYTFPTTDQMEDNGENYADLVEFYTKMSFNEFKDYVTAAYNNEMNDDKAEVNNLIEKEEEIAPQSYDKTQKYYYDTTSVNYLYIIST
ncbi:MAG: hypothetical protein K2K70_11355, partial [Lachnospiraceae bacterium]|nr:hypothetical protein [Lachnospiraceae bacterium]